MAKHNYLIEGVSGSGKSSVCAELQRHGYHAVDADTLSYFGDPKSGSPVDVEIHANWLWNKGKMTALLNNAEERLFICGGARNRNQFIDRFKKIFYLTID